MLQIYSPNQNRLNCYQSKKLIYESSAYESSLSEFHKLTSITKGNPSIKTVNYSQFHEIFLKTVDSIALIKKKILHFNLIPSWSKHSVGQSWLSLSWKVSITKTELKKTGTAFKQRNFCVNLQRKTKKDYFNDLNIKILLTIRHSGKLYSHTSRIKA